MSSKVSTSEEQDEVIIGARALGDQIYKIMPTYDLLLEQLNEVRLTAAKQIEKSLNRRNVQNKQDFNNTVGIFGPRGTGKSSALYTLRVKLNEDKYNNNILLPLIEPDNFGENTKIIGSIVGLLCEEGRKLLQILKNESDVPENLSMYFNNDTLRPNNPLKQIIDETIEYHLYTERQYRDILGQNYADFATHIRKSERLLIPDIEFKKKLMILIDTIVDLKKSLGSQDQNENSTVKSDSTSGVPLIYIFIDDIDLKTSKTRELMDALLQYTNHPNVITVLSGDYEILTESLTLALLQDEPLKELGLGAYDSLKLLDRDNDGILSKWKDREFEKNSKDKMENLTILKRKTGLAHEYLKKIIPPARRHQLVKWNETTIPNFGFGDETLLDQLVKLMGRWSIFSYKESEATNKPINRSYLIFDERPRGIVNAYYHLNQLLKAKEDENINKLEKHFQLVKAFIDTLILSNTKLLPHQEFIYERFLIWGSEAKSSSIQYEVLSDLESRFELEKELVDFKISLYVISEIVRNLLPDVMHDHAGYFNWRRKVMSDLLIKPHELRDISEKNIIEKYIKRYQYSEYRLFFLVETIALLAEPEIAALLAQLISNTDIDLYYKNRWDSENAQVQDEFVIKTIHNLLLQEEEMRNQRQLVVGKVESTTFSLLEGLCHQAYSNQDSDKSQMANFSLNLLESLSAETAEVVTAERQFKLMMDEWDRALENARGDWTDYIELQIKRSLFLNSIIFIKNMEDINYKFDVKSTDIGHTLNIINSERENIGSNVPDVIYSTLENRMKIFAKDIRVKFSMWEIEIELDSIDQKVKDNFLYKYSGVSLTRYQQAKNAFRRMCNTKNYKTFSSGLQIIENLSQNNRVYYGRNEASALLPNLRAASRFSIENFSELELVTIQQYAKYVGANQIETGLNEYEGAKKSIQNKLLESKTRLEMRTLAEIRGYNLEMKDLDTAELSEQEIEDIIDNSFDELNTDIEVSGD
ncbi:hypothetical protein SAMN05428961_11739 [Paenibacillus sp. OK060]|uniref:hypothetical protein n=1 Tax=Paenibacillus sp. OK060 TaxID=1881034 RepID=UPI000887E659|nr:hypothetical protein [Paenibacillus sp. OK060]SDM42761.1 hypothetical protein SAMN05428961_11739 [Paenibacillus sp. OK060]